MSSAWMARIMNVHMMSIKQSDLADVGSEILNVNHDNHHVVEGFTLGDLG